LETVRTDRQDAELITAAFWARNKRPRYQFPWIELELGFHSNTDRSGI
jgi:hypothetical protein